MAKYITDLNVSVDEAEERCLKSQGYLKIDVDLNKGAGGKYIYLWYKRGCQNPITRVQATFNNDMARGLSCAGYTKIDKDLNAGAGGDYIYLWYYRGSGEFHTPIVDIQITADAENDAYYVSLGWERVTCDLNRRAGGNWIHVLVNRECQTYICDVAATDSYSSDTDYWNDGYIRMDEDTNRDAKGSFVFIWYRHTTSPQRALTDLAISTNDDQSECLQQRNYHLVNVDLNKGAGGSYVYLWHKKVECNSPIKSITLLLQCDKADVYESCGVNVIQRNLNTGNIGTHEYLCYYK